MAGRRSRGLSLVRLSANFPLLGLHACPSHRLELQAFERVCSSSPFDWPASQWNFHRLPTSSCQLAGHKTCRHRPPTPAAFRVFTIVCRHECGRICRSAGSANDASRNLEVDLHTVSLFRQVMVQPARLQGKSGPRPLSSVPESYPATGSTVLNTFLFDPLLLQLQEQSFHFWHQGFPHSCLTLQRSDVNWLWSKLKIFCL